LGRKKAPRILGMAATRKRVSHRERCLV